MSDGRQDSPTEQQIEALVRQVVTRTLGRMRSSRPLLDEAAVRELPAATTYRVPPGMLITPLARQVAMERRITLEEVEGDVGPETGTRISATGGQRVAIGADHGGYGLKEQLKPVIEKAGFQVIDCGTHSTESVDYPDYAFAVARLVSEQRAEWGIIIDGAGIGSSMVANKVHGVRAAMCYDQATAVNSREHNNANVLTLGAGLIGPNLAQQIVQTWLATPFGGGRHARRVAKIDQIDERYNNRKR